MDCRAKPGNDEIADSAALSRTGDYDIAAAASLFNRQWKFTALAADLARLAQNHLARKFIR